MSGIQRNDIVALSFQDTPTNFFADIHILMEKSIRIGNFLKLETGQEGYTEDVAWRTTRVRMLPNNEGIEIPFPHRTVYVREEKDWKS
jgi:small-conductance mechanosensitive channel